MDYDYLLEKKLKSLNPDLSEHFKSVAFVMSRILEKTVSLFPDFTDHTIRHSLFVMEYANRIIGNDVNRLNEDEIYILMCAVYAHDFGMSIDEKTFDSIMQDVIPEGYIEEHPEMVKRDIVRTFHGELSAFLITKYSPLFEFPSEEYTYCIAQVAKGHRKADLFDRSEFNPEYTLPNGNRVCLPYLAAIMRLCDEMDITVERNDVASYIEHSDILSYRQHFAIKKLTINDDGFVLNVQTDEDDIKEACRKAIDKLRDVLDYCISVVEKRTDFEISQKTVEVVYN